MEKGPIRQAIEARRTVFEFRPEPVPEEVVMDLLEAGTWAPNHHLTEPWRFTLIGPETKKKLGERYAELQVAKVANVATVEQIEDVRQKALEKWMARPTMVAVSCVQEGDEQQRREDFMATCCAMVLIQLAGWERGIGMQWSTHPIIYEKATYELLGIPYGRETIVGFYYMGYPATIPTGRRRPVEELIRRTP
ncbi:MAG: nitroreductase [Candidatus Poribacteria bacterium]|nr:MAG: nitroreductase [Candidatus Poribacteria bacterium]